jgi:hypothetical protein
VAGLEGIDPSNLPGYPPAGPGRDTWLVANAPKLVLVAEFASVVRHCRGGGRRPAQLPAVHAGALNNLDGPAPAANEFVSPFAGCVVRFSKPVDMETVKSADTFFFAMRDLTRRRARTSSSRIGRTISAGSG